MSTQRFFALPPVIRLNATSLYVFRLRNDKHLQAFLEETSALADKKTLLALYKQATAEPYSFLFAKLTAPRDDMFWLRFEHPLPLDAKKGTARTDVPAAPASSSSPAANESSS